MQVSSSIFKAVLSKSDTNAALSIRNQEPSAGSQKIIKWNSEGEAISWQDPSLVSQDVGFLSFNLCIDWHTSLMPQGKYSGVKQQHVNPSMHRIKVEVLTLSKTKHALTKCICLVVTNVASVFS